MAQLEQLGLLYDCSGKEFLSVVSWWVLSWRASRAATFLLAIILQPAETGPASPNKQTCCFYTCQLSIVCVCARLVCMCFPQTVFPCLLAQFMWVCILQCLAVGGWFESVSQREIVFRLCLLFPIRGQYANSRCQPSCCVLVWCLRCMTLAANHTALPPLLYPAGVSSEGNPAMLQLQQSGSLDRVRSDKIPLRWIFSATEDRRSRGYEHALSKMVIWEVIWNNNT